jgi:Putative lumazine-binding
MRKVILLITAIVILATVAWQPSAAQNSEEAAVRKALEHYLQGHATGSADEHRKAFHTEMRMSFVREGKLNHRTLEEYVAGATGKAADDEAKRKRWIESVDIAGNAAIAKLVLDYPSARITDYMSLLKVDGEWRIIGKIFHAEPKSKR